MLFNSYEFILFFLPTALLGFYLIGNQGHHRVAISWLVGASLFFYGWWNPTYLGLILLSIIFNYAIGSVLANRKRSHSNRLVLILGIGGNLALIGYFKYANFFVDNINTLTASSYHLENIILPLAISFFTFQQITYLVDAYRGESQEYNFLHYCLFVTFFPQLIAGPIVHHREMLPQFAKQLIYKFNHKNLSIGLTIFFLGLFKKVVLADGIAVYATPVFDAAEQDVVITFFEAWGGALAYTFQLYFDFSGYSDMAIGIARMFGILLPMNFHSPYKATNIIEFWRRWHITLSRFLRDYLYFPLGGNRKGKARRHLNLMITMLLGGLWHGAGWTFVAWGGLHGFYLMLNHAWQSIISLFGGDPKRSSWWGRSISQLLTFIAVVVAWVFFRAETFNGAINVLQGMVGINGFVLPGKYFSYLNQITGLGDYLTNIGWVFSSDRSVMFGRDEVIYLGVLLLIVLYAPNTQQFMSRYKPVYEKTKGKYIDTNSRNIPWRPQVFFALFIGILAAYSISTLGHVSEFLYFQF